MNLLFLFQFFAVDREVHVWWFLIYTLSCAIFNARHFDDGLCVVFGTILSQFNSIEVHKFFYLSHANAR